MRYNRLIILTAAVLLLFSACSGSPGAIVPDFERYDGLIPDSSEIKLGYDPRVGSLPVFSDLVNKFNKTNKYGIVINIESQPGTPVETADLAIVPPPEAAKLLKSGKSIELSPLIYHPVWGIGKGRSIFFKAACRQTDYWDFAKKITSLPLLMDAGVMIVNNRILDDTGFRRFPRSWVGMTRLLRKSGNELHRPTGMELDAESIVSVIQARGGSVLCPAGFSYSINNPVVNRTLRYLRRYEENKILSMNRTKYSNQTDFVFGRLLAVYTGIDGIMAYDELISMADPDLDWGIELLPTRKPGDRVAVNCIYSAAVMKGTMEKQLASWLFIKWLTEAEQQKRLSAETGSIPAVSDVLSEIIRSGGDDFPQKWLEAAALISDSKMEQLPSLYDYNKVSMQFEAMVDRIFAGGWVWLETIRLDKKVKKERRINS